MKKKKKGNKARKSLTAVGAVVAAGLTPGFATSTPASQTPGPDVEFTAADVISINGEVFDFDELFAMGQVRDPQITNTIPSEVYGPPAIDPNSQEALRERARLDSIRRAEEMHALVYGPPQEKVYGPRPAGQFRVKEGPEWVRKLAAENPKNASREIQIELVDFCYQLCQGKASRLGLENYDLINHLNFGPEELDKLQDEIERTCGVLVTEEMLKQLGTVERITNFIVTVITPIKD